MSTPLPPPSEDEIDAELGRECGWVEPFDLGPVEFVIGKISERTP